MLFRPSWTAEQGAPMLHAAHRAREVLAEAARFLHALREHDLDLASCTQGDVDDWLTTRIPAHWLLPVFLTWAQRQHHLPAALTITAAPAWQLGAAQPADQRWQLARRLLHDDTLPTPTGVVVHLRLGADAIQIGEPLATLLQGLPVAVSTGTARGLASADPWLFPGRQPGRPVHPTTLGHRLRRLGIDPRAARNSALLHLAEHLPASVLADLLGLHIVTAERWRITAGTRWMSYAGNH